MNYKEKEKELTDRLIDLAFAEDIGDGDHTTLCCIPADAMGESELMIKEEGIFAGERAAKEVFHRFDPDLKVTMHMHDGDHVRPTRKTTPGMRMLEKEAVRIGGGMNHRIGLFDMILLKDNHIDFCGGVHNAITRARQYCKGKGLDLKIECEVRDFTELQQAIKDLPDRIMFDNFTPADTVKAVALVHAAKNADGTPAHIETESSGGITFDTMIPYAKAGVDFISFGALTHSVKALDMSLKAKGSSKLSIK